MQKSATSIRSLGHTMINVDKPTKSRLKRLAGDMPLVEYLRHLADQEDKSKQSSLSGMERQVSKNTIAAVKEDTERLTTAMKKFSYQVLRFSMKPEYLEEWYMDLWGEKPDPVSLAETRDIKHGVQSLNLKLNEV